MLSLSIQIDFKYRIKFICQLIIFSTCIKVIKGFVFFVGQGSMPCISTRISYQ